MIELNRLLKGAIVQKGISTIYQIKRLKHVFIHWRKKMLPPPHRIEKSNITILSPGDSLISSVNITISVIYLIVR